MENFDWDEFRTGDIAVHCDTEEKANDFLKQSYERGIVLSEDVNLLGYNRYDKYKEDTCYRKGFNKLVYGFTQYYIEGGYKIIKWEIDNMKGFTKEDLKVGMLVHNDLTAKLGNAMIIPTEKGLFLAYKNGACGNIDFSTITKVWGYPAFFYEAQDFSENHRKLLYEKIKKMTVKEICDKLGYKVEIVEG